MSLPVIFVHSSFRTGSTWFQSRFRQNVNFCTFTEAYNEQLAKVKSDELGRIDYRSWDSRHPASVPYFMEYLPLIDPSGGVHGFKEAFAFERYFPEDPNRLPEDEYNYLSSLINQAQAIGKIPVITFTRSFGRMNAIKRAFGGTHIFTYRNLFNQWCSYTQLATGGNLYFIGTLDRIIGNCHDQLLVSLCNAFNDGRSSADDNQTFFRFVALHLYLYKLALASCDFYVCMDELQNGENLALSTTIASATGHSVDFFGYQEQLQFSLLDIDVRLLREVMSVTLNGDRNSLVHNLDNPLLKLCNETITNIEAYQNQAGRLIKCFRALLQKSRDLEASVADQQLRLDELAEQKRKLEAEAAEIRNAHFEAKEAKTGLQRLE